MGIQYLMSRPAGGEAAVLVPGGAPESLNSDRGEVRLILKPRKGFVKLALRTGVSLVPTFSFGESEVYKKAHNPSGSLLRSLQNISQAVAGFAPVFFLGRGIFQYSLGIVPYRIPITVVVGAPIKARKIENPSTEDIERLHAKYVRELEKLYREYNPNPEIKLYID